MKPSEILKRSEGSFYGALGCQERETVAVALLKWMSSSGDHWDVAIPRDVVFSEDSAPWSHDHDFVNMPCTFSDYLEINHRGERVVTPHFIGRLVISLSRNERK